MFPENSLNLWCDIPTPSTDAAMVNRHGDTSWCTSNLNRTERQVIPSLVTLPRERCVPVVPIRNIPEEQPWFRFCLFDAKLMLRVVWRPSPVGGALKRVLLLSFSLCPAESFDLLP